MNGGAETFLLVGHAAQDREAALDLVGELECRGVRCRIAPPGQAAEPFFDAAIGASRAVLLVFSGHGNDGAGIGRKAAAAAEAGKPVILYRTENTLPRRGLGVRLSKLHWIDGFAGRERAIDALIRTIDPKTGLKTLSERLLQRLHTAGIGRRGGRSRAAAGAWALSAAVAAVVAFRLALLAAEGPSAAPVRTLAGHAGDVRSVAFSPDGRMLASASLDETVRLWDPASGEPLRTLADAAGGVLSVAFSPAGGMLASGSKDAAIRLWEPATGALLRVLAGHTDWVLGVAFSPDGRRLASAGRDGTLKLWDTASGRALRTVTLPGGAADWVAFGSNGTELASTGGDHAVVLRNPATGESLHTLAGHRGDIRAAAFSPDATTLASASADATVKLWAVAPGEVRRTLDTRSGGVVSLAFSPDGNVIATAGAPAGIGLWDTATGALLRTINADPHRAAAIAISPDGGLLAAAADLLVMLWDIQSVTGKRR